MKEVVDLIVFSATRTKLVIIMPSPRQFDRDVGALYKKSLIFKRPFVIENISVSSDRNAVFANTQLDEVSQKFINVFYINREAIFNVSGKPSDLTREFIPYSWEGSHISIYGAKMGAESFLTTRKYEQLISIFDDLR